MRLDTPQKRLAARTITPDFRELRYDTVAAVIYVKRDNRGIHAKAYRGTAYHPEWNYLFLTPERFEAHAQEWIAGLEQTKDYKAQLQSKRTGVCPWKVGQTLKCSWGYDQTNIDFYEVIAVRGQVVDIQEIGQHFIDQQGPGGDTVIPFRGHHGKVFKSKRPQTHDNGKTWYLKMTSYSYAYPWDGRPAYQTDPSFGH